MWVGGSVGVDWGDGWVYIENGQREKRGPNLDSLSLQVQEVDAHSALASCSAAPILHVGVLKRGVVSAWGICELCLRLLLGRPFGRLWMLRCPLWRSIREYRKLLRD